MKIINGKLQVSLEELLSGLTLEEKQSIADFLSCEDDIIKNVADQIVTGWTESSSHGGRGIDDPTSTSPLDVAIRYVAQNAGTIASEQFESLKNTFIRRHAYYKQIEEWAWKMFHMMERAPMPPQSYDLGVDKWDIVERELPGVEA